MHRNRLGAVTAIALILLLNTASACFAADIARSHFDLPAQPLAESLRTVAVATHTSLVFDTAAVSGVRAPALKTRATPDEALTILLEGSGFKHRRLDDRTIVLEAEDASKGASARSTLELQSTSDAADRSSRRSGDDSTRIDEVIVTGTHLRGISPESSPVLVFTRKDIEASGRTSIEQFMQTVPQNFQGGVNQENFNVSGSGQLITQHGAGINLRGLGQRATLVLLDGKRLAPSGNGSFVDVSLIPLSAVQRLEVLTDGASAIYGSDAVGGVVNLILRRDLEGFESEALVGSATSGDGDQLRLSQSAGTSWDGGNALVAYEYRRQDKVLAGDRQFNVNVPPTSFFLPEERRHSVLASIKHQFTDHIDAGLLGTYAERKNRRDFFVSSSALILDADADAQEYSVAGDLTIALGADWNVQVTAAHSRATTGQLTMFTDGRGLFNKLDTRNDLSELGVKLDGKLFDLPGGSAQVALGGQFRDASHQTRSTTFIAADQTVRAIFGEVMLPWFSAANALPGIARLELNAAVRAEDYNAYGSTVDPKIGLLWAPVQDLKLRATYGTSFRAPLPNESTGIYAASYEDSRTPSLYLNPSQGTGIPLLLTGFDPQVTTEQSETWTAGFDYQPTFVQRLKLTANYFRTRFDDRITLPTTNLRVIGNPAFETILIRNPSVDLVQSILGRATTVVDVSGPGSQPGGATPSAVTIIVDARTANTAITRTDGIDFSAQYDVELDAHHIGLSANATYLLSFDDQLTPAAAQVRAMNSVLRPVDLRARAAINWAYQGWTANAGFNYTDGYSDVRFTPVRSVEPYETVDVSVSYRFAEDAGNGLGGLWVSLNALNVFDADPPFVSPPPGATRGPGYDPVNASGLGRFVSLQLRKTW